MENKAHPIDDYRFMEKDGFLFDANIWLLLYARQDQNDQRIPRYSKALKRILQAKSRIFIDLLVLSEYMNRYARIEHDFATKRSGNFKSFRNSPKFKPIAADIVNSTKRILNQCERIGSSFEQVDMDALLSDYQIKCPDFNDQMLAETCKIHHLKLVTDDADFKDYELTLLTANRRLLIQR
jgi:predicted nucleic acid-binding protein